MRLPVLLLFIVSSSSYGQFQKTEMTFVKYLIDKKQFNDAILVLEQKLAVSPKDDSLNYLLGKVYYNLQNLPEANKYLSLVSSNYPRLYQEGVFLSSFNSAYMGQLKQAQTALVNYHPSIVPYPFLKDFQLAGLALLSNDFHRFDSLKMFFTKSNQVILDQQEQFSVYRVQLAKNKQKSPFKAGALSALVPGLGRVYAGKKATGIYSLLVAGLLGAQAYEGFRKDGVESVRFILYSSLFTAFYLGNIWGSALSVKMIKNERDEAIHKQILLDLHIPLRTLFR